MLYIDTETTGLSRRSGHELVEVAVVSDDGSALLSTLVNPGQPIPTDVRRVGRFRRAKSSSRELIVA